MEGFLALQSHLSLTCYAFRWRPTLNFYDSGKRSRRDVRFNRSHLEPYREYNLVADVTNALLQRRRLPSTVDPQLTVPPCPLLIRTRFGSGLRCSGAMPRSGWSPDRMLSGKHNLRVTCLRSMNSHELRRHREGIQASMRLQVFSFHILALGSTPPSMVAPVILPAINSSAIPLRVIHSTPGCLLMCSMILCKDQYSTLETCF